MYKSRYDVSWASRAFSDAECDAILRKFLPAGLEPGKLMMQNTPDVSVRKSSIRFVPFNEDDKWIFDRLAAAATMANQELKFELKGFDEGFQLGCYSTGDFYHWHADLGDSVSALRKLSLVAQLTSPEDYAGGELEFFPEPIKAPRERGTIIVFPSYVPHRVLPVTSGVRYSIASWIAGATPFR
jgi:PKHD-type hydroxylase